MKKVITATVIGLGLYSAVATAFDGTITVTGKLLATTCAIAGNAGKNVTVTLPTVGVDSLDNAGDTAGSVPFVINLTGCPQGQKWAQTEFEISSNVDVATGNLKNLASVNAAGGVQVQIIKGNGQVIDLRNDWLSGFKEIVNGAVSHTFYARYVATGKATAGDVSTTINYTMSYI